MANGFANQTLRDGGDNARHRRCPATPSPGQRDAPERRRRGDARRVAHNPEVEGSNPSPATKARGPFSNRERAFCMWSANGYVNVALVTGCPSGSQHGT